jgi:LacI family transcriptional regulator
MNPTGRKQIVLAFSVGVPRFGRLMTGVLDYVHSHDLDWSFVMAPEDPICKDLPEWPGDGIIANLNTFNDCRLASAFRVPIVNISGALDVSPFPRVLTDDVATGRLAARHLMDLGFKRFAYYGLEDLAYSKFRMQGFRETLEAAGFDCDCLLVPPTFQIRGDAWSSLYERLEGWLKTLDCPVGLFVVSDYRARLAIEVSHNLKIPIPRNLAMVSVDNEETLCETSSPSLSSIDKNELAIGWETARILDDMISGRSDHKTDILVTPRGVVSRGSTDTVSVEDHRLADAIEFIRQNYQQPITVDWIAQHIDVSRRWLEGAFRDHARVSPYQYLTDYRVIQAKRLLVNNPGMSIRKISELAGFSNPTHFNSVFKRVVGESPTRYRSKSMPAPSRD